MPDITMCNCEHCPTREDCYRYIAKESYHQSYFITPPYDTIIGSCEYYWKCIPTKDRASTTTNDIHKLTGF